MLVDSSGSRNPLASPTRHAILLPDFLAAPGDESQRTRRRLRRAIEPAQQTGSAASSSLRNSLQYT